MATAVRGMARLHDLSGRARVALPVTAGMLVIMIVFLPLLSLQGLEGKLFAPVALTIIFALGASLLCSLTVIPVLASLLMGSHQHATPKLVAYLEQVYARWLQRAMAAEKQVLAAAGVALLLAVGLFTVVGKSFMPTLDEGDIIMQIEKLPSVSLAESARLDGEIQRAILAEVPDVLRIVARAGSDELGLDPMGLNETDTFMVLKPHEQWQSRNKEELMDALRKATASFPGINLSFTQPIEMRTSEMLSGVRGDVAIKVYGPDTEQLDALASQIVRQVQAISGSEDVLTVKNEGVQYLQVEVDRLAAGRLGLNVEQVQADLRTLIEGRIAGVVVEGGRRLPLLLRGAEGLRLAPERFAQLQLPLADGSAIPLSQLARLQQVDGPVKVERENGSRMVVVRANVHGRDLVGFVEEAKARIAAASNCLPAIAWPGVASSRTSSARQHGWPWWCRWHWR
jgi:cobalt-zinc-cadmium resistance protein CzcA